MTPLIRITLAWIIGITLARGLNLPWPMIALAALPALGALLLYRSNNLVRWGAILVLVFCAGVFRLQFFQPTFDQTHVAFYNDSPQPVTIFGLVVDEPDVRDDYINLPLRAESIDLGGAVEPVQGLVLG